MAFEEGVMRRNTRAALAEIPIRLGELRVSPEPLTPLNFNTRAGLIDGFIDARHPFVNGQVHNNNNTNTTPTSSTFLSPTPSPDEMVIQQRGRRRIPVTWSPDIDYKKSSPFNSNNRTPPKAVMNLQSPTKNGIVLRSTPRKRLLMSDFDRPSGSSDTTDLNEAATPQKYRNQSPTKNIPAFKRFKIERPVNSDSKDPLDVTLKGMTVDQLVNIIKNVAQNHPEIEDEVRNNLPSPDLKPAEDQLFYLKKNIFRSLPTSRLYSKTDSPAYSRAATHVLAFKKYLVEQGKILMDSRNWHSVLEYGIMAWSYVRSTPLWDNYPHNAARRHCFKYLAGLCMNALKRNEFDQETMLDLQEKFETMLADSDDIRSCLKFVECQSNNLTPSTGRRGI